MGTRIQWEGGGHKVRRAGTRPRPYEEIISRDHWINARSECPSSPETEVENSYRSFFQNHGIIPETPEENRHERNAEDLVPDRRLVPVRHRRHRHRRDLALGVFALRSQ